MPVVFITGGARRIGKGLATRFAQHGYDVGIIYHTSENAAHDLQNELTANGLRCSITQADVSIAAELTLGLDQLMQQLGEPDVIVSNAGVFPPQRAVKQLTVDNILATLHVNTLPLFTIAKWYQALPVGRLISISSLGAFEIWMDRVDYNLSKTALVNLTQSLARALAPSHTVNSVAPGAIMVEGEPSEADEELARLKRIPMGRYGTPDDIFDAVWFFATASTYITGQVLVVDGGYRLVR
jgi:3-oxoacyl-[acyl-carrier protein] reductase/pteridine reductase